MNTLNNESEVNNDTPEIEGEVKTDTPEKGKQRELTEYEKCLKREIEREKQYRLSAQGAFEYAMTSLDAMISGFGDPSKQGAFSDGGYGSYAIARYLDGDRDVFTAVDRARNKIVRTNKKLLEVFYLILKNGKEREKSIWELMVNHSRRRGIKHTSATTVTSKNCSKYSGSRKREIKV